MEKWVGFGGKESLFYLSTTHAWCVKVGHYLFYLHLDRTKEPLLRRLAVMAVCVHQMAL